jgi:hypothetical protein
MRALRKAVSITLLVVLCLLFVQPLLALGARSEANLPACCRRNGEHHCMRSVVERSKLASRDTQFQAPVEKCPYCPTAIALNHGNTFAPPTAQAVFADLVAHPAIAAQTESRLRISRNGSRQKRGPPSLSRA